MHVWERGVYIEAGRAYDGRTNIVYTCKPRHQAKSPPTVDYPLLTKQRCSTLVQYWASVADAGPVLKQCWSVVSTHYGLPWLNSLKRLAGPKLPQSPPQMGYYSCHSDPRHRSSLSADSWWVYHELPNVIRHIRGHQSSDIAICKLQTCPTTIIYTIQEVF